MVGFDAWDSFACIFEDFKNMRLKFEIVITKNLYTTYPPAPLLGATRLRGICLQLLSSSPFNHQLLFPNPFNPLNHLLPNLVSPCSCLLISNLCLETVYWTWDEGVTLIWACSLNVDPPAVFLRNHQISSLLPIPSKIREKQKQYPQGHQKTPK